MKIKESLSVTGSDRDAFLARLRQEAKTEIPYDFLVEHAEVGELNTPSCKTLIFAPKDEARGVGVLYLAGGGFLNPPRMQDYELAVKITEKTGCDVIMPLYPLFPENPMEVTIHAVEEAVKRMDDRYPDGASAVLGFSSGATLCIYAFLHLKEKGFPCRMPERWILNSPILRLPPNKDELHHMEIIEPFDVTLPISFLKAEGLTGAMVEAADPEYRYLADILSCNLMGMPKTDLYYGTKEIAYAYMEPMINKCRKQGIELIPHEGLGMMHCWGLFDAVKEGKAAQKEYFNILNSIQTIK